MFCSCRSRIEPWPSSRNSPRKPNIAMQKIAQKKSFGKQFISILDRLFQQSIFQEVPKNDILRESTTIRRPLSQAGNWASADSGGRAASFDVDAALRDRNDGIASRLAVVRAVEIAARRRPRRPDGEVPSITRSSALALSASGLRSV